jgi:hypothetical protein
LGIYDIKSKELRFCEPTSTDNPLFTSGLYNDIDCGPRFFPKVMVNDNTMAMWVNAIDLKNHVASADFIKSEPKFPDKKAKLRDLADNLSESDNPVLVLITIKK